MYPIKKHQFFLFCPKSIFLTLQEGISVLSKSELNSFSNNLFINEVFVPVPLSPIKFILYSSLNFGSSTFGTETGTGTGFFVSHYNTYFNQFIIRKYISALLKDSLNMYKLLEFPILFVKIYLIIIINKYLLKNKFS